MRVTGGEHGGRRLAVPKGLHVRPTTDKVRQALFNILLKYGLPADAAVLDAFCGSGALGIEALSRGAASCVFMDNHNESLAFCRDNIAALKLEKQAHVLKRDSLRPGSKPQGLPAAQLVLLDPPYHKGHVVTALAALAADGWVVPGAICVAECETEMKDGVPDGFLLLEARPYRDTQLLFVRFESAAP